MIRLASGRLFYVGDFYARKKGQPEGSTETGAYLDFGSPCRITGVCWVSSLNPTC